MIEIQGRQWCSVSTRKPETGRKLVFFRARKKKFCVGTYEKHSSEEEGESHDWVSEYGQIHQAQPEDLWMYLPKITITTTYGGCDENG